MTLLKTMASVYENERRLWRIHYDHMSKLSAVQRGEEFKGHYDNGGSALYAMEELRSHDAMRLALHVLADEIGIEDIAHRLRAIADTDG